MKKINFLGLSISQFDKYELEKFIINTVQNNEKKIFYGYGLIFFYLMTKYNKIYNYAEKSDLFVIDGRIFYFLTQLHGLQIRYEISIPQLVFLILEIANRFGWNVFLLGATEQENKKAKSNIEKAYPTIGIVSGRNGYFNKNYENKIINYINEKKPQVVLVGISSPTKEEIAFNWKEKLNANIILPCGGMIDVLSGKTKITPNWAKKIGLATIYRIFQEPKRLLKARMAFFGFFIFRFIPVYFLHFFLKKNKEFPIQKYFNTKNF
jgi:N-acetylglucosaminyldiphosphoundecaprenol N-acetyl-beta-D-mannosaminyltransferase